MNSSLRFPRLIGLLVMFTAAIALVACGSAESRKAAYVEHGKRYFEAGDYNKARVEFGNAAQIDPKDAEVHFLLGQIAEKTADLRGAVGQYQAAIDLNPRHAAARAALAQLYVYGGLPDKALELVEPGLAVNPNDAGLLTVRGAARARLGNADAALQDAQRAVQLAPGDDRAVALLASLYRARSQLDQAIAVVQTGLQRLPKDVDLLAILADLDMAQQHPADAEAQLKQIVTLEPKVLVHRYQLARFYLQERQIDLAEQVLRNAAGDFPDSTDAKLQLLQFLAAQRGRDQAIAEADQLVGRASHDDGLTLAVGDVMGRLGQSDRAERDFRTVMAHDSAGPQGLAARDRLAALLFTRNDVVGATALISYVLQQSPHDNDALVLRSNLSLASGDVGGAIADLRAVLRDQPNAVAVMRMLAGAYQQNGERDLAEETLRQAVQVSPGDFPSRLDLAQVLISANKSDQAQVLLEQLAKEAPTNVAVLQTLFQAQAAQKHTTDARATAQDIEKVAPTQALGYYFEGVADEADQKPDAAAKDYDRALQLQPTAGEPLAGITRLDLQHKRSAAALARLDAVIAKFPTDPVARTLKAGVLLSQGQTDAAIAAYQQTVQSNPGWPRGYSALAQAQLGAKRNEDAVHTLQLGVEHTHGDTDLLVDLANLYERIGRPEDAIALYRGVLAKNPHSLVAANNLAMLLVTYRRDTASLDEAQKLADQLESLSAATVVDTRGWVKFKEGDFHAAESLLQQAVDASPEAPEFRYHLGMAQLRSGEPQAAQQNLQLAVRSPQPFVGVDDARATLAHLQKTG